MPPLNATAEVNSKQPSREGPTNEDSEATTVGRQGSRLSRIFWGHLCIVHSSVSKDKSKVLFRLTTHLIQAAFVLLPLAVVLQGQG